MLLAIWHAQSVEKALAEVGVVVAAHQNQYRRDDREPRIPRSVFPGPSAVSRTIGLAATGGAEHFGPNWL